MLGLACFAMPTSTSSSSSSSSVDFGATLPNSFEEEDARSSSINAEHSGYDFSSVDFNSYDTSSPLVRSLRASSVVIFGKPGRTRALTITMAMASVGSGVLALPSSLRSTSLAPGLLLLLSASLASWFCNATISRIALRKPRANTYASVAKETLGEKCAVLIETLLVVLLVFVIAALLVVLGDALLLLVKGYADMCAKGAHPDDLLCTYVHSRSQLMLTLLLLVIFPLSLIRDITSLRFTSLMGALAIAYVLFTLCYGASLEVQKRGLRATIQLLPVWTFSASSFVSASPVILLSYGAQAQIPLIVASVKGKSKAERARTMRRANVLATLGLTVLYVSFGVAGNLCFPGTRPLNGDILTEFASFGGMETLVAIARLLMVIALTLLPRFCACRAGMPLRGC